MYSVTDYILEMVPKDFWQKRQFVKAWGEWADPIPNWENQEFSLKPEQTDVDCFRMFNTGGVEVEVGEFLYALTRIVRPAQILETGTHFGISDLYFSLALKANGTGNLTTIEFNPPFYLMAQALFEQMGVDDVVELVRGKVEKWDPLDKLFDIVFLDTEPHLRFDEMNRLWPNIRQGGFIIIHDLHSHLGLTRNDKGELEASSFGDFRERIGDVIKEFGVQTVSFPTPRGLTMFQRFSQEFGCSKYLAGEI